MPHRNTGSRALLYLLLAGVSIALLAVSAYRVRHTKRIRGGYEPIIIELIVSSILTILWVPLALLLLSRIRASDRVSEGYDHSRIMRELLGLVPLWLLWLAGAVTTTNRILPGKNWCSGGDQCNILTTILALAWTGWSLLTLLIVLNLLRRAASYTYRGAAQPTGSSRTHATAPNTAERV